MLLWKNTTQVIARSGGAVKDAVLEYRGKKRTGCYTSITPLLPTLLRAVWKGS
jgi:hypothetical protein